MGCGRGGGGSGGEEGEGGGKGEEGALSLEETPQGPFPWPSWSAPGARLVPFQGR